MEGDDVWFGLFLMFLVYAIFIYPIQVRKRVIEKILDVYREEMAHGIREKDSKMAELIKELGEEMSDEHKD